jgi:hypothetical protein
MIVSAEGLFDLFTFPNPKPSGGNREKWCAEDANIKAPRRLHISLEAFVIMHRKR